MKKKIGIILSIILGILLISGISVYAYLSNVAKASDVSGTSDITGTEVEVASFAQLFQAGTDTNYNSMDDTSLASNRKVLKLTANITLTSDLVLTKDVQINLNGKTLDLNNHVLTFKHGYAGCSGIYSTATGAVIETGIVTEGTSIGKIVVDLIQSGFTADNTNITYKSNNAASNEAATITVINIDEKYTAYSALYMVGRALNSSLNKAPDFENYATVSDSGFALTVDKFLPSMKCETANTTEYCAYVYQDLDLPFHYLSSDITISYNSNAKAVISDRGNVTISANSTDVTFTATVSRTGWTNSYSVAFKLHAVKLTDTTTKNKVRDTLIKSYLKPYRKDEALVVNQSIIFSDYYYGFNHAIELPKTAFGGLITYSYSVTNYTGTAVEGRISNTGSVAYFEPSSSCYHLVVNGEALNMYSTYVSTKESAAYLILNHLYGGAIIYDKTVSSMQLQTVERINADDDLTVVQGLLTQYGVTAINYAIKSGSTAATYYNLASNAVSVKPGAVPPDKADYITVTFTFSDETTVAIDVYIDYLDAQGSTLSSFLTYYSIYDPEVPSELLTTFEMPFAYNNSTDENNPNLIAPYIVYDVAIINSISTYGSGDNAFDYYNITYNKPVNLNIQLYYNGAVRYTFPAYSSQSSFSAQLDAHLTSAGYTLATVPNDAKYIFSINAQESLTENQKLIIIYNYKFNASDASWTQYSNQGYLTELNTTPFTVLGGLFYDNDNNSSALHAVKDQTFFLWIFNKFRPSHVGTLVTGTAGENQISLDSATTIIPIDWLGQDIVISRSDTALSSVTDYSGIGYLKNVTTVDLSGSESVSNSVITGLARMPSLTNLNLSNCNLTDISALSSLTTVKVLDISQNKISYFDALADVTCLEKVYLYSNLPTSGDANYIGSTGICSFQAYADLMRHGCAVYNQVSNNIPVLYAESYSINDYRRLKSLVYQEKLAIGKDITVLYQRFAKMGSTIYDRTGNARYNNPQIFGLQTAGTLTWGYEAGKTAGTATYFYANLAYSNGYTLRVKYYVDRYTVGEQVR